MALSLPSRAACRSSRPGAAPRHPVARCAAAASSSASPDPSDASYDPYAVLGITPLTSPEEVLRAKTRKLQAAATADGAAAVEAAYDAVMLRQLQRRLRGEGFGGVGVSAAVRLGDVDPLAWLPAWRPRVCVSGRPEVLVNLAVAAALVAYTLTQPLPGVLPLTAALVIYFFRVNAKLVRLMPSPEGDKRKAFEEKRMLRVVGLVLGSVASAIALVCYGPALVMRLADAPLPAWVLTRAEHGVNVAVCVALFLISSFYR